MPCLFQTRIKPAGAISLKTAVAIGGLIGTLTGIPSVAYLLSPAIQAGAEDDAVIPLGHLRIIQLEFRTASTIRALKVNGWERTGTNYGLFVVRKSEDEIRVFSDICTHLGCRVTWHAVQEHDISPCHDGHFDIVGDVVSGPPPRPLDEFVTKIEDGNLYIQLPAFIRTT